MFLEKIYKNIGSILTNCLNSVLSILKIALLSKFKTKLPHAKEKTCIILGNGPSLSQSLELHADFFKQHALICVNSFSITSQFEELQPLYYVMLDPGFWLEDNEVVTNTIHNIRNKTTWKMYLLLPFLAKKSATLRQLIMENKNIQPVYYNYVVFKGFKRISHFFFKLNWAMPQSQNVLVASIFLGINIGFKKIYIVGADHTFHTHLHVDNKNILNVKNIHFYEQAEKVTYTPFYKGAHTKETFRMHEILVTLGKAFYGYVALNEYAKSQHCTIYNASEYSFVDAFERIKLPE